MAGTNQLESETPSRSERWQSGAALRPSVPRAALRLPGDAAAVFQTALVCCCINSVYTQAALGGVGVLLL